MKKLFCPAIGGYGGRLQSLSYIRAIPETYSEIFFHDHKDLNDIEDIVSDVTMLTGCITIDNSPDIIPSIPLHKQMEILGSLPSSSVCLLGSKKNLSLFPDSIPSTYVTTLEELNNSIVRHSIEYDKVVVKSVNGSGSKNIHILPTSMKVDTFNFDDEYVVQPFIEGDEIVVDIAAMSSEVLWTARKSIERDKGRDIKVSLNISSCEVEQIVSIISNIVNSIDLPVMCFNMQLRKVGNNWKIMELDTRFSGSSSINMAHTTLLSRFFESSKDIGKTYVDKSSIVTYIPPTLNSDYFTLCEIFDLPPATIIG